VFHMPSFWELIIRKQSIGKRKKANPSAFKFYWMEKPIRSAAVNVS
jgi:hypothetical protein